MKIRDAILLLLYQNNCEPITSMKHLESMLVYLSKNLKLEIEEANE